MLLAESRRFVTRGSQAGQCTFRPSIPAHRMTALPEDFFDRESFGITLGIQYEEFGADRIVATMPVTPRVHQEHGYLHGGASVVLAESVASVGAHISSPSDKIAFGLEINANHIRPKKEGVLRAIGTPLHKGRTTQVWEVRIEDEDQRLICISRCTIALVDANDAA